MDWPNDNCPYTEISYKDKKEHEYQVCRFCLNPESILTLETCCTGCIKLKEKIEK